MWVRRPLSLASVVVFSVGLAVCPKPAAAPQNPANDSIKVQTAEVVVDAIVTDKHNRIVSNLTADDFTVYEDGVAQKVTSFRLFRGAPQATTAAETERSTAAPSAPGAAAPIQPSGAQEPPSLTIVLLDYSTVELQNQKLVREASEKYVREKLRPNERVAVFRLDSSLHCLTNFTNDRDALLAAVKNVDIHGSALAADRADLNQGIAAAGSMGSAGVAPPAPTSGPGASSAGAGMGAAGSAAAEAMALQRIAAQYVALQSAVNRELTRQMLTAIRAIALGVKHIPGRKSLLLFSQGFVIAQSLWPELQTEVDAANRAQLAIYSIDAHGLETRALNSSLVVRDEMTAALGPTENERNPLAQEDRMKANGGEDMFDRVSQVGHDLPEASLRYLAQSTGGFLIHNTNDLSSALTRISEDMRTYYVLSYLPTNRAFDGKFRQVKVEVRIPQLSVRARGGYYAIPAGFELLSPEEYQLLAQARATDPGARLPLYLRAGAFREAGPESRVPVILEIPTSDVQFEKRGDAHQARFQILGLVRDSHNEVIKRFGGPTQLNATSAEYDVLKPGTISFLEMLQLATGSPYSFEVAIKDQLSGKVSHAEYGVYLREAQPELSLSTVLLAKEVEKSSRPTGNFLSVGDLKILPSARCEFKNGDNLIFYFDVYNPQLQADKTTDLNLDVFLTQDGRRVGPKVPTYHMAKALNDAVPAVTVARFVQLAGLSAGNYSLVVNVQDSVSGRSQSAHAAFSVTN